MLNSGHNNNQRFQQSKPAEKKETERLEKPERIEVNSEIEKSVASFQPSMQRQEQRPRNSNPQIMQSNNSGNKAKGDWKEKFRKNWIIVKDFLNKAFVQTPYETIFELMLLIAGGTRTIQLFNTMGQTGFAAAIGIIYSELGIILYEFLEWRGKKIKTKKRKWWKLRKEERVEYDGYPFINQQSVARVGLWVVHIPLTVIFTTSDLILINLETMTGTSMSETFAWVLGIVIGVGFFLDLSIINIYKNQDPKRIHDQKMFDLKNEKENFEFEKEELELKARLDYERKNAKPLIELRAKLGTREKIVDEFSGRLGSDYVEQALEDIGLGKNKPRQIAPPNNFNSNLETPKTHAENDEANGEDDEVLIKQKKKMNVGSGGVQNFPNPHQQQRKS